MANPQVTLEVCVTASILRFFRLPPFSPRSSLFSDIFIDFSLHFSSCFVTKITRKKLPKFLEKFHENKLKEKIHQKLKIFTEKNEKFTKNLRIFFFVFLITKKVWISLGKMFIFNFYLKLNFQYCWSRLTFSMNSFLWSGISLSVLAN